MSRSADLEATIEELRCEDHPRLPKELVERVLAIEADHVEDRGPAPRLVEAVVDEFVETKD